jgi:hypothetical protein
VNALSAVSESLNLSVLTSLLLSLTINVTLLTGSKRFIDATSENGLAGPKLPTGSDSLIDTLAEGTSELNLDGILTLAYRPRMRKTLGHNDSGDRAGNVAVDTAVTVVEPELVIRVHDGRIKNVLGAYLNL